MVYGRALHSSSLSKPATRQSGNLHVRLYRLRQPPRSHRQHNGGCPINTALYSKDYTILNTLHAAINEDATDMILARDQTAHHL